MYNLKICQKTKAVSHLNILVGISLDVSTNTWSYVGSEAGENGTLINTIL